MKKCSLCGASKATDEFYATGGNRCKACRKVVDAARAGTRNDYLRQWRRDNPEKHARSNRQGLLRRRYGISIEQYEEMLAGQGGTCAACKTEDSGMPNGTFVVDHDHATGNIRGLLCNHCNLAIGHAKESVDRLKALVAYMGGSPC